MMVTNSKTTQVSFRLNQDLRTRMKASNTISKQNPVSILKRTATLNAPATKSAAMSRVLKTSGTVSKEPSSCGAPGAKVCFSISTNATTVTGCIGTNSRVVKVLPQATVTSLAPAKMPKQPVKPINAPKIGPVKKLTGVNIEAHAHERNSPPSTKTTMLASFKTEKLLKEGSSMSVSRVMPSKSLVKVGLNQLIIVSCEEKQQVYCQLCSVRLRTSSHSTSFTHCCNYVKMKYPGWTAHFSNMEDKLKTIVANLAEIEKSLASQKPQRIEVKKALYQKLAALSEKEAVEELKAIVKQDPRASSSTAEVVETSLRTGPSPCEVSSSDDGKRVQQKEISRFPGNNPAEQKSERLHQMTPLHVKGFVQAADVTQGRLQPSISCNKMDPGPASGSKAEDLAGLTVLETVKQDPFIPDSDARHHRKVTLVMQSPRVKVEKADPLFPRERRGSKSASPCPDALEAVNCRPKGEICSSQKRAGPLPMKQTGPSLKAEAPGEHSTLQSPPITSLGRKAPGCSNLSLYFQVRQVDTKRVIGIDSVWECRGICLETFFLCESCEETLSRCDICRHMASLDHQLKYMWKKHLEFLQMFWLQEDLPHALKMNILQDVVWRLAERDRVLKMDAKCIILERELHQFVRTAPFSEALKTLQNIFNEEKLTIHLPLRATHHLNAGENTKSTVLEEVSIVGMSDGVTETVFSPVDMNSSSSKTNSMGSSVPNPGINLAKGTKPDPSLQPEFKSTVSWPQSSGQELVPKSISCAAVRNNLDVSIGGPTRKRPADAFVQILHKTSSPLQDPLPAKRTVITRKIKGESSSPTSVSPPVNPAAGPPLLPVKEEGSGPKQVKSTVDQHFSSELISHLKQSTSKRNLRSKSANATNSCAISSLEMPHTRWDSQIVNIKSESKSQNWDSKCQLVKATVKKTPPSNSLEANKVETCGLECKKELVTTCVDTASSANISSSEDFLKGSVADAKSEDKPVTALAAPADLCDLPNLQFFNFQQICGSSIPSTCSATNHNSGRIPEPKRDPEPEGAEVRQLSFKATRKDQPSTVSHMFLGSYKRQTLTDVTRAHQISFHVAPPPMPTYTVAASTQPSRLLPKERFGFFPLTLLQQPRKNR